MTAVLKNVVLLAAAVILSLLLLEGLARLMPPPHYAATWLWDPLLGHRGPRSTIVRDGYIETAFDRNGFRGDPIIAGYPGVTAMRVVILGDSFTEGASLPWAYTYGKVLERGLLRRTQRDVEVVTFAASDYGTANELLAYERWGPAYAPDIVLVQFFGLNDFINNGIDFGGRNQARSDFVRPYVIPEGRAGLPSYVAVGDLQFTYLYPRRRFLREHSGLFRLAEATYMSSYWRKLARTPPKGCLVEAEVFLNDMDERWRSTLTVTERLARELRRLVAEAPVGPGRLPPRLLAFYVPSVFEVDDDAWRKVIAATLARCHPGRAHGPGQGEAKFRSVFEKAGIATISLRGSFADGLRGGRNLYLPDGHFTVEGHRLAGEILAEALARGR